MIVKVMDACTPKEATGFVISRVDGRDVNGEMKKNGLLNNCLIAHVYTNNLNPTLHKTRCFQKLSGIFQKP